MSLQNLTTTKNMTFSLLKKLFRSSKNKIYACGKDETGTAVAAIRPYINSELYSKLFYMNEQSEDVRFLLFLNVVEEIILHQKYIISDDIFKMYQAIYEFPMLYKKSVGDIIDFTLTKII